MKVKHKVTGEIHEVIQDTYGFGNHSILARTKLDLIKQNDRKLYDRIVKLGNPYAQSNVRYMQEPATDFEEIN